MVIVLMGVSGSGKTTVGRLLAARLDWVFYDADDYHSPQSVAKMRSGRPLSEQDRLPWIERLSQAIRGWTDPRQSVVLACSALTRAARDLLGIHQPGVELVYLHGPRELLAQRIDRRVGHYFPSMLLESQLDTLQEPRNAHHVDVSESPEHIVDHILHLLELSAPGTTP
jgi:gluconokinase